MAKVTITIEDDDATKQTNISIESDPAFPGPANKDQSVTGAQSLGLRFLRVVKEELEDCEEGCACCGDDEEDDE